MHGVLEMARTVDISPVNTGETVKAAGHGTKCAIGAIVDKENTQARCRTRILEVPDVSGSVRGVANLP